MRVYSSLQSNLPIHDIAKAQRKELKANHILSWRYAIINTELLARSVCSNLLHGQSYSNRVYDLSILLSILTMKRVDMELIVAT